MQHSSSDQELLRIGKLDEIFVFQLILLLELSFPDVIHKV